MAEVAISLGSNLGDKAEAIESALRLLDVSPGIDVVARSRLYRTEPWGDADQDWFLNACALIETELMPDELLAHCLAIESALGRDRTQSRRWGPRPIDIDILSYDDIEIDEPYLVLPHPHMFERAFVLVPLHEIAPEGEIGGRHIEDALKALDTSGVTPWIGPAETSGQEA